MSSYNDDIGWIKKSLIDLTKYIDERFNAQTQIYTSKLEVLEAKIIQTMNETTSKLIEKHEAECVPRRDWLGTDNIKGYKYRIDTHFHDHVQEEKRKKKMWGLIVTIASALSGIISYIVGLFK